MITGKNRCARFVLMIGIVAAAVMAADTKTYRVALPNARIGTVEVVAGEYSLTVDGDKVQFKELNTGKAFAVTAKVENLDKKTDKAEVHSVKADGTTKIAEIRPRGAKIRLDFREQTTP